MREDVVYPVSLLCHGVRLGIRVCGQQEIPRLPGILLRHFPGIELPHPSRKRVRIVPARRERPVRESPPIHIALAPSDRQNRAAILARDGEESRSRIRGLEPVGQRRSLEPDGRRGEVNALGPADHGSVGDAIHSLAVHHDSRMHRESPRHRCSMAGCRFGNPVVLVALQKDGASVVQSPEPTGQLFVETLEIVRAHLIYRHKYHERGMLGCRCRNLRAGRCK